VSIDAGSMQYLVGPAIAALALLLLALFLRWSFGRAPHTRRPGARAELLVPVATVSRPETAQALRSLLSDAGIRSTVRTPAPHRTDVLVFPEDAERARALALGFAGG
jgi:hypothetical protein